MIKEKVERRTGGESQDKWFVKLQLLKVAAPCSPLLFVPACLSGSVQKCNTNYKWSEKFQVLNLIDRFFLVPLTWT